MSAVNINPDINTVVQTCHICKKDFNILTKNKQNDTLNDTSNDILNNISKETINVITSKPREQIKPPKLFEEFYICGEVNYII